MIFFPMPVPVNENPERESNPMLQLLYLYLSGSEFLVSTTDPYNQLFNVKSAFKSLDLESSVSEIYRFFTLFA